MFYISLTAGPNCRYSSPRPWQPQERVQSSPATFGLKFAVSTTRRTAMPTLTSRNTIILRGPEAAIASLLLCALCAVFPATASAQSSKPAKLECESLSTPIGMDAKEPLLSWKLEDLRPGARQTAYEIQVASTTSSLETGKPDIWD